jgi:hypothetical protein
MEDHVVVLFPEAPALERRVQKQKDIVGNIKYKAHRKHSQHLKNEQTWKHWQID